MSSSCIQSCIADIEGPVRVNFVKIYQWPQSDAEFLKEVSRRLKTAEIDESVSSSLSKMTQSYHESIACRQRYLRSYVFSTRRESAAEKTKRWIKVHVLMNERDNVHDSKSSEEEGEEDGKKKNSVGSSSCNIGVGDLMVKFLLSCIAKVDVYEE